MPSRSTRSATNKSPESINDDDVCPICQLLLYKPVTTQCGHTLCESCMAIWADVSVTTQMQIVEVDEQPVPFNPVSGLEARCPMCRTHTTATLNTTRTATLTSTYPRAYAERQKEESSNLTGEEGQIQTLTLSIGNKHRVIPSGDANKHEWTFFVRPSRTDIIEEVHINLHPTFRPARIIRSRAPYEVTRYGWGIFTVLAHVMLKPGYSWVSEDAQDSPDGAEKGMLGLEWGLDFERFEGRGSMGRVRLKVRNQRDWKGGEGEAREDERGFRRFVESYRRDGAYVPPEE